MRIRLQGRNISAPCRREILRVTDLGCGAIRFAHGPDTCDSECVHWLVMDAGADRMRRRPDSPAAVARPS